MSHQQHHTYFNRTDPLTNKMFLGGEGVASASKMKSGVTSGTPIGNQNIYISTLNNSGVLQIGSIEKGVLVPNMANLKKMMSKYANSYHQNYSGHVNNTDSFIYSPWYDENYNGDYVTHYTSGEASGDDLGIRFLMMPRNPETCYIGSDISSGDTKINLSSSQTLSRAYNTNKALTGKSNFEMSIGYTNGVEKFYITGTSGDYGFISGESSGCFTGDYKKGVRVCALGALHSSPSGETGHVRNFQVRIDNNAQGQSRFYLAGSGLTGGCHLGGTFTGSGYTFFETPIIDVYRGFTYYFNQHHSSNHHEYMMFSYTSGGHHEGADSISGKYEVEQAGSQYCFNNYCNYHCPDEQTLMIPIETGLGNKIYYYASGTAGVGGTGYLNVLTSGDGDK